MHTHRHWKTSNAVLWMQVDVVTPTGKLLARRLSLIIEQGHSVLVTGPNGSGKSSLFRILGGLWPMTSGSIHRPGGTSADARIFYVPQKPYTTIGTLREQVSPPSLVIRRDCLVTYGLGTCFPTRTLKSLDEKICILRIIKQHRLCQTSSSMVTASAQSQCSAVVMGSSGHACP